MIRILHHHLRRGGVTRVMVNTARILLDAGKQVEIWSGEGSPESLPDDLPVSVCPGLAYRADYSESEVEQLVEKVRSVHREGDLWQIHNHSLGKSPVLTEAVSRLAEQGLPLLLQIHDFAEDGRPANLANLRTHLPNQLQRLYPLGAHIHYAVLQERDMKVLRKAGVDPNAVSVLPNPISAEPEVPPPASEIRRMLYLTRGIRRKNIGEFILWAEALKGEVEFATSLCPENPSEKAAFEQWVAFAARQHIPVRWGTGMSGRPFAEVAGEGDACVSTSVGEGFGMSFLEPYRMGRPVCGRDLPDITSGFKEAGVNLDHLYAELPVPLDSVDDDFRIRAVRSVNRWRSQMGVTGELSWADLSQSWVKNNQIDFGRLDEKAQRHVLCGGGYEKPDAQRLRGGAKKQVRANDAVISQAYSFEATRNRLERVFGLITDSKGCTFADAEKVRDAFTELDTLSMLRLPP